MRLWDSETQARCLRHPAPWQAGWVRQADRIVRAPGLTHMAVTQARCLRHKTGFTLLEIILAVVIATGVLIGALLFYRQLGDLRAQVLLETDRLTAIRLLLDRISADLRGAHKGAQSTQGLKGDTASLQLVRLELPPLSAWAKTEAGRAPAAQSDLRLVNYRASTSMEGTNLVVSGLVRTEEPLLQPCTPVERGPNSSASASGNVPRREPEPLTDVVRFVRFRYWNGTAWLNSWNDTELPQGVELSLGMEPSPTEGLPEDYPFELFRRVVYLPGHGSSSGGTTVPEPVNDSLVEPGGMP